MNEIKDILKMSVGERIHLVQTIWDSIAEDAESAEISVEHKEILKERLEAYKKNPEDSVSWEEVQKIVDKKL